MSLVGQKEKFPRSTWMSVAGGTADEILVKTDITLNRSEEHSNGGGETANNFANELPSIARY